MLSQTSPAAWTQLESLAELLLANRPAMVLTGAGCSTNSGIPDYRDREGNWKNAQPIQYADFIREETTRKRYWARSMAGWPKFAQARPNNAHLALARMQKKGFINLLVTQNVDGLHQQAGSENVVDLHGRLDNVICLDCGRMIDRHDVQARLEATNPEYRIEARIAPDGDAQIDNINSRTFIVPVCEQCNGMLKPDVVFFGETVPAARVTAVFNALQDSGCLLIVGSSAMVFSGFRFCREALKQGKPIAAINRGRTRVDDSLAVKIEDDCGKVLTQLNDILGN